MVVSNTRDCRGVSSGERRYLLLVEVLDEVCFAAELPFHFLCLHIAKAPLFVVGHDLIFVLHNSGKLARRFGVFLIIYLLLLQLVFSYRIRIFVDSFANRNTSP